jgi:putative cell wall-binding protein
MMLRRSDIRALALAFALALAAALAPTSAMAATPAGISSAATPAGISTAATPAANWWGDFFDGSTSGQATYEDAYIGPEAVALGDVTYVVYQGRNQDPYISAYDRSTGEWSGPHKVGDNPLADGSNPFQEAHGAPALLVDPVSGYLHVFYGAHQSALRHARSAAPRDPSAWVQLPAAASRATYPQTFFTSDGAANLFYRNDTTDSGAAGYRGWMHRRSADGGQTWGAATAVVRGDSTWRYYASFRPGAAGTIHATLTAQDWAHSTNWIADQFNRRGIYYMRRDAAGAWRNITGASMLASGREPNKSVLDSRARVFSSSTEVQNDTLVADDFSGEPALVFLSGSGYPTGDYRWRCARFDPGAGQWVFSEIARTDHFFDAGAIEFETSSTLVAYLNTPGSAGFFKTWDPMSGRGGNIVRFRSSDGGASWSRDATVAVSTNPGVLYGDPQLVRGASGEHPSEARVVFAEWDNDVSHFFRKTFLWGEGGFARRQSSPKISRVAGADRYATSVQVSRKAFPIGAAEAFVASGRTYTDALAAAPLAYAKTAPLLIVDRYTVPSVVLSELRRLKVGKVTIVGGTSTVSSHAASHIDALPGVSVSRISGSNRYEVARQVALKLKATRTVNGAVVVDQRAWPDALCIAPLAAYRGWPILLADHNYLPPATASALSTLHPSRTVVVGDATSVGPAVFAALPSPVRVEGPDRYAVSAAVARFSVAEGLRLDRFGVTTGASFADALGGGVLMGRAMGPLLLTPRDGLPDATKVYLGSEATHTLDAFVLGGEASVGPGATDDLAEVLQVPAP